MNSTSEATVQNLYHDQMAVKATMTLLYVIIFIVSILGNAMVITIICRFKHLKRVPGNLFIVNLALCDLLTPLISIPLEMVLLENNNTWPFGSTLCKLFPATATLFATSSSLTLAAISLDRYRTLMHPFKQRLDTRTVKMLIAFVHCCSGILVVPHLITSRLSPNSTCKEVWPNEVLSKIYTFVLFLAQYALPLIFMAFMYIHAAWNLFATTSRARSLSVSSASSKGRRNGSSKPGDTGLKDSEDGSSLSSTLEKHFSQHREHNAQVTKVFVFIVVVFALFTLPIEVLWIWGDFAGGKTHRHFLIIAIICRLFTYANSCLNPFIFYKFNRHFHQGFVAFFRHPSSCGDDNSMKHDSSSPVGNGKYTPMWLTPRGSLSTPRFLTPRGSFQSAPTHSGSFLDHQSKTNNDCNKTKNSLDIPSMDQPSGNSKENQLSADKLGFPALKSASDPCSSNANCNISINVSFYESDLTIALDKLDSLIGLPQTDC